MSNSTTDNSKITQSKYLNQCRIIQHFEFQLVLAKELVELVERKQELWDIFLDPKLIGKRSENTWRDYCGITDKINTKTAEFKEVI